MIDNLHRMFCMFFSRRICYVALDETGGRTALYDDLKRVLVLHMFFSRRMCHMALDELMEAMISMKIENPPTSYIYIYICSFLDS